MAEGTWFVDGAGDRASGQYTNPALSWSMVDATSTDRRHPRLELSRYAETVRRGAVEELVAYREGMVPPAARVVVLDVDTDGDSDEQPEETQDPFNLWD
jgi:hypothetical protein